MASDIPYFPFVWFFTGFIILMNDMTYGSSNFHPVKIQTEFTVVSVKIKTIGEND